MCYREQCKECGRPSYGGCGMHVEQVLGNVPPEHRCQCREQSDQERPDGSSPTRGILRKLFGGGR